jgi:hypothetical protein
MSTIYEKFVSWYLRFNGYFTIDNFIVHAADDENRIRHGIIAPYTETDSLAIRMPYSAEIAGKLKIANHDLLVESQNGRFDVVIAEVKSGNSNRPNPVWRDKNSIPIKYILRFIGLYKEDLLDEVTNEIVAHYCYENTESRVRYIIFANEPNEYYLNQGVQYISFSQIAQFLVDVRGQCWADSGIGVSSLHDQWDPHINKVFEIANDFEISPQTRQAAILDLLASEA